jgi:hypothetical protein
MVRAVSHGMRADQEGVPVGGGAARLPASAELGRQLVELLVDRIGRILDDEFPDG